MSAVDDLFNQLKAQGKKAFMPFITAGDPDLGVTKELLSTLDQMGCHLAELGIPFSDPIADGPTIQASYTRALDNGVKLEQIMQSVKEVAPTVTMPVVLMISYAMVFRQGVESFVDDAKAAGIAGLIVPDLPIEESNTLSDACRKADISLIQLVTPTTPKERAVEIAKLATGFIYYVSVAGITGERTQLPADIADNLKWLREQTELPICVGFGIAGPEQVEQLAPYADGLIVGSAIVRRIHDASANGQSPTEPVREFCQTILSALNG